MNRIISTLILLISLTCQSQETKFQISDNVHLLLIEENLKIDSSDIFIYRIRIENNSDSAYIFWFSETNKTNLTQKELINEHFFKPKGDFNLIQLATETLTKDSKLPTSVLSVFTKIINQHTSFDYNIVVKHQESEEVKNKIIKIINNQVVLIPVRITNQYFNIETIDRIIYKPDSELIDWSVLRNRTLNK